MSEVNVFLDTVYKLHKTGKYSEVDTYITNTLDFMHHAYKHEHIDGILYNINLSKINAKIARLLIYNCGHYADKLIMLKDFINKAIDEFGKSDLS